MGDVTQILQAVEDGDGHAAERLLPAIDQCLRSAGLPLSQIDPRYLTATTSEALPSVLRTRHLASSTPVVEAGTGAGSATRIVAAAGRPILSVAASEAAPRIARQISTAAASDVAMVHSPYRKAARASLGLVVASGRAWPRVLREGTAAVTARLVANGAWSERPPHHRCVLTRTSPDRHVADIIILSGDRCHRDQPNLPGPSTGDGTVKSDEPPSCRGPPSAAGHRSRPTETSSVELSAKDACGVLPAATLQAADPIVRDNLGHQVPIGAAELDVIETYLDEVLRDALALGGPDQDSQAS